MTKIGRKGEREKGRKVGEVETRNKLGKGKDTGGGREV
jgi:hypothetical protein